MSLHVVFVVAEVEYVLPVAAVLQMESFGGATAVPGSPPYVLGVVTVRGRVVPVVDVRRRFGLPGASATPDTRIIVTELDGRVVALCVDRAREVIDLDPAQRQAAPDLVSQRSAGLVAGMHALGKRLLLVLDLPKVLSEDPHDHEPRALLSDETHERLALPG
ncbi:MAG TPA: chemotaxis protein CheW [Polyangiaceae bacterium]|nr:chemotaxis protein CheW [Polyangiaceae bacterium]